MKPPIWVDTEDALRRMIAGLSGEAVIALDTESDSLYRYHYRVCLIQISSPSDDYLVDPLPLGKLTPLGDLLASERVEKVFHAAENDIHVLKRDFSFAIANVFDTMLASRILGWPRVGLAAVLGEKFGVEVDKRAQLTDWRRRPLTQAQMRYARLDTHYLLPLRKTLIEELTARGRLREAQETFAALPDIQYVEKAFDPDGFWRVKGARELTLEQMAVLRELYLWREDRARTVDLPPYRVMSDSAMVQLVGDATQSSDAGPVSPRRDRRHDDELLAAVRRGLEALPPKPPERNHNGRPLPEIQDRFDRLRSWRTQRAAQRGVESDVVLTNEVLMALARANPATYQELAGTGLLGAWKLETYGDELVRVLSGTN